MDTVVVFTSKDLEAAFEQGGSGDWVANKHRVAKCSYLVAVANAHTNWSRHTSENHSHAFLIGKIAGMVDAPENPGRFIIQFSEYAEVDIPNAWAGQRNPVRYTTLDEFGVDPNELNWVSFPKDRVKPVDTIRPLTVEEAKCGLAKKLGVTPDCIEIIVRA